MQCIMGLPFNQRTYALLMHILHTQAAQYIIKQSFTHEYRNTLSQAQSVSFIDRALQNIWRDEQALRAEGKGHTGSSVGFLEKSVRV